jgi:MarR family transcriptional regulator, organic hydroperoxide resistance regulator
MDVKTARSTAATPASADGAGLPAARGRDRQIEGTDPVVSEVFRAFKRTMHLQRQLMWRLLAEEGAEGLHPGQAGCLLVLGDADSLSQRDLADRLHVARPTVTTMLQAMEKAGLVVRQTDADDQRLTRVNLTEDGRRLTERMKSVSGLYMQQAVGSMSGGDRQALTRLLDTLGDNLARALGAAAPVAGTESRAAVSTDTMPDMQASRRQAHP